MNLNIKFNCSHYKDIINGAVSKRFWLSSDKLQNLLDSSKNTILENFESNCENSDEDSVNHYLETLKNSIKSYNKVVINDNNIKLQNAEKSCTEAVNKALQIYNNTMESALTKRVYFNIKDLQKN